MPMVEILYVREEPIGTERRRAFVEKATRVFDEELGTRPAQLRMVFQHVQPEDSKLGLVDESAEGSRRT